MVKNFLKKIEMCKTVHNCWSLVKGHCHEKSSKSFTHNLNGTILKIIQNTENRIQNTEKSL